jgi:hypothetical protein
MPTKAQRAWSQIISHLDIEFENGISQKIHASDIKDITGEEPRLVCYIDSEHKLPPVLRERNAFVLPVGNGVYRLVEGQGFQNLPEITSETRTHTSTIPFKQEMQNGSAEDRYIKQALNSGLISRFTGIDPLLPGSTARTYCNEFSFEVGSSGPLRAESVQIQVDGIFEGRNAVATMEAKTDDRESFVVRQLYYPFRHYSQETSKSIRSLFFVYDDANQIYNFWEYEFQDPKNYSSIELKRSQSYKITHRQPDLSDFQEVDAEPEWRIPQADDLSKVQRLVFAVDRGCTDSESLAEHFEFERRQANYYEAASELLGLVTCGDEFELTDLGREFTSLRTDERNKLLLKRVLSLPVTNKTFQEAVSRMGGEEPHVSREEIRDMIMENTDLSKPTANRRARTIEKWLRWAADHVGLLTVEPEGVRINL